MNIYIGNLPRTTDEETVRNLFAEHGEVSEVNLIKDKYSGELRGFGFVEMPSKEEALKAIQELDGKELGERTLIVNEAKPRSERPGNRRHGGSGGGGGHRGGGSGGGGGRRGGSGSGGGGGRSRSW